MKTLDSLKKILISLMAIIGLSLSAFAGTVFTVNSLADPGAGAGTTGSLRYCITTANVTAGSTAAAPHTITFTVTGNIALGSNLPIFNVPIFINGASAPGYGFWVPKIQLTGFSLVENNVAASGSHFKGLVLSNANPHAFDINGVNNITIEECFIGTNTTGTAVAATAAHGILIQASSGHLIKNNIISGSGAHGVLLINAPNVYIIGNNIGCNAAGTAAIANGAFGILLLDASSNIQIGGYSGGVPDSANVISGNSQVAIGIQGVAKSNIKVIRNTIGLNKAGTAALGNQFGINDGSSTTTNFIIKNNVISASSSQGVYIAASSGVVIKGNYIGTNATGTTSIANAQNNIDLNGTNGTIIGGSAAGEGNIISGTSGPGIHGIILQGGSYTNNCVIKGNYIGTNASGTAIAGGGNKGYGIVVKGSNNIIGGLLAGEANIISGNGQWGVLLTNGTGNQVIGNLIGVDKTGAALGNGYGGVVVRTEVVANPALNNQITNNTIAYNGFTYPTNPSNSTWILANQGPGIGIGVAEYGTSNILAKQDLIQTNAIYCNAGLGISLNKLESTPGYGNINKAAPVINAASTNTTTFGTSSPNDVVQIFANPTNCGCQGEVLLGTVTADGAGNWTLTHANVDRLKVTATGTDAVNNTSEFTLCINPASLPVEYIFFKASLKEQGKSLLEWQVATETNNAFFTIEKSFDGKTFFEIGTVKGAGNSTQIKTYPFTDDNFTNSAYYRIKQTDIDGKVSYTAIRYLDMQASGDFLIYPNPTTDNINISGAVQSNSTISIILYNSLSQIVDARELKNTSDIFAEQVNMSALSPGIYFLSIVTQNKIVSVKIIKQ